MSYYYDDRDEGRWQERELSSQARLPKPEWVVIGTRCEPTNGSGFTHIVWASTHLTRADLEAKVAYFAERRILGDNLPPHRVVYDLNVTMESGGESALFYAYGHSYAEDLSGLIGEGKWDPDAPKPEVGTGQKELRP